MSDISPIIHQHRQSLSHPAHHVRTRKQIRKNLFLNTKKVSEYLVQMGKALCAFILSLLC